MAPSNRARSGIKRQRKSILSRYRWPPDKDSPLAPDDTEELVDYPTIAWELTSPLVNEPHTFNPRLLSFADRRALPTAPANMLNEFGDVAVRRCSSQSGRQRRSAAWNPFPRSLRCAAKIVHEIPRPTACSQRQSDSPTVLDASTLSRDYTVI
jgi:hypothetical protein